jgi:hypothetical protein
MSALLQPASPAAATRVCERCGLAADARHFDASGVVDLPQRGRETLLARVELASQYCGVLEFFSQYTDEQARHPAEIETPGLQWLILLNRQVLAPYENLQRIVNPWGFGSFQFHARLPEGATLEFVVRRRLDGQDLPNIRRLGGRLVGRSWYDASYGGRMAGRTGHVS